MISGIHHVQLAIPAGEEDRARTFYGSVLGMSEVEKPQALAARGGAWFRSGTAELHLGVEEPHRPAHKAHPGLLVEDLDAVCERLEAAGVGYERDELFPGYERVYVHDPFGNRLELLAPDSPT